MNRYI